MSLPPGSTDEDATSGKMPARALLQRIDIGLTTGVVAVLISFLALIVAWNQTKLAQDTAKAGVLPVLRVETGHNFANASGPYGFVTTVRNDGAGIAYIQRATHLLDGEPVDMQTLEPLVTGRYRGSATLSTERATGYLPAGERLTPVAYYWTNIAATSAVARDLAEGGLAGPIETLDAEVCYCSVFDDCWVARASDTAKPRPVNSCGRGGVHTNTMTFGAATAAK